MLLFIKVGDQPEKVSFWSPISNGGMMKDPCNKCLVTPCCTEACRDSAKFWSKLYKAYKKDPNMHGLNFKQHKTLEDLHEAAGHRPVSFEPYLNKIRVTIHFSIDDPPHKPQIEMVKTIHEPKRSV